MGFTMGMVKVELQGLINGLNSWSRSGWRRYSNISCSVSCFITDMSSCADMSCMRRKYIKMENEKRIRRTNC